MAGKNLARHGLTANAQDILHFAAFGVALRPVLIGLKLEPQRLQSLRRPIPGWGSTSAQPDALVQRTSRTFKAMEIIASIGGIISGG